jgi:hypothetical protein
MVTKNLDRRAADLPIVYFDRYIVVSQKFGPPADTKMPVHA